jgi:hypothetical protein
MAEAHGNRKQENGLAGPRGSAISDEERRAVRQSVT